MRKVVVDTTPLLSLLKLNRLDLLHNLYGKVIIPHAVFEEIEAGKLFDFYEDLSNINWIEILRIQDENAVFALETLDAGEAETIALAIEINADLVVIDEKLGRYEAKKRGLRLTGTLGILLKAKEKGFISEIKPLLSKLTSQNRWISNQLIAQALLLANEK